MSQTADLKPPVPGAQHISSQDMAKKRLSTRSKARKSAVDILFEADLLVKDAAQILLEQIANGVTIRQFTKDIIEGVILHQERIDEIISANLARSWTLERMPRVDRQIARVCVWELLYTDIVVNAAISEAVELADCLSTEDSVKFLNGLLAKIAKQRTVKDS